MMYTGSDIDRYFDERSVRGFDPSDPRAKYQQVHDDCVIDADHDEHCAQGYCPTNGRDCTAPDLAPCRECDEPVDGVSPATAARFTSGAVHDRCRVRP